MQASCNFWIEYPYESAVKIKRTFSVLAQLSDGSSTWYILLKRFISRVQFLHFHFPKFQVSWQTQGRTYNYKRQMARLISLQLSDLDVLKWVFFFWTNPTSQQPTQDRTQRIWRQTHTGICQIITTKEKQVLVSESQQLKSFTHRRMQWMCDRRQWFS